jgi:RNA polymerase sigma factor (sigma-70 family)
MSGAPDAPRVAWAAEAVVSAAQRGEERAIARLVTSSHPHVHRLARSLCSTPQDAEDAAQEALVVMFGQIGTLRATAALTSWMFRITWRECLRHARRALLAAEAPPVASTVASAEEQLLAQLESQRLVDAIAALPEEQRAVLVLRDLQGYSDGEAADALGLSRAAVKARLHRARVTLRVWLAPGAQEPAPAGVRRDAGTRVDV